MRKKFKINFILILLIIGVVTATPVAQARVNYPEDCNAHVIPFNPDPNAEQIFDDISTPENEGSNFIKYLTPQQCESHLSFTREHGHAPRAGYNPQPVNDDEVTSLPENIIEKSAPTALHEHAYFNDTRSDESDFWDLAKMKRFEIHLENDAARNVIAGETACFMPIPDQGNEADNRRVQDEVMAELDDCSTNGNILTIYGGTKVTKSPDGRTITWEFGLNPTGSSLPISWGDNGDGFPIWQDSNPPQIAARYNSHSDHYARSIGAFQVHLTTKNNVDADVWSATTTSRALVFHRNLFKRNFDPNIDQPQNSILGCVNHDATNPQSGWCNATAPAGSINAMIGDNPRETRPMNWIDIGSVATIWRKPSVPPPPPEVHLTIKKLVQNADGSINRDGLENDFELFTLREEEENNQPRGRGQNGGVQLGNAGGFFDRLIGEGDTATQFASGERTNFEHNVAQVVEPGTYVISEEPKDGYTQIGIKCNGERLNENNQVTITDRDVTCTINNRIVEEEFTCPADRPIPHNNKCYKFPYPGPIPPVECEPGTSEDEDGVCIPDNPVNPIPTICVIRNGVVLPNIPVNTQLPGDAACNGGGGGGGGVLIPGNNFPGVALEPFRFEKTAFRSGTSSNMIQEGDNVSYDLKFIATLPQSGALIKDDSFDQNRRLRGSTENSSLVIQPNNFYDRNLIDDEFKVFKNNSSEPLPECRRSNRATDCYLGNPFVGEGVRVNTPLATGEFIRVHFDARLVTSRLNCQAKQNDRTGFCGETFPNIAHAIGDNGVSREARASLYTPCPFLLTRGIGDIIIGSDFQYGFDTSGLSCAGVPNIEGEIIFPEVPPEEFISPGAGSDGPAPVAPEGVCKRSNDANSNNPEDYKNPAKLLSSGICELKLNVTEQLTHDVIQKSIEDNVARFTRTPANLPSGEISDNNINTVGGVDLPNPNYAVYKRQGNLRISQAAQVEAGSRTFIVQDGDLIIDSDIKFNTDGAQTSSFKNTPSIAFIVINGNIKIGANVKELDGVFVALQGSRGAENSGKITGAQSDKPLVFDGAVVGDIEPLFKSRTFTGDAKRNEGTIVINYGAWLYYNLPPVLRDIIDLQQIQTAR